MCTKHHPKVGDNIEMEKPLGSVNKMLDFAFNNHILLRGENTRFGLIYPYIL